MEEDPLLCICLQTRERELKRALKEGAYDLETLIAKTGAGSRCTACWIDLSDFLLNHLPTQEASRRPSTATTGAAVIENSLWRSTLTEAKRTVKRWLRRPNVTYTTFGIEQPNLHTRIHLYNADHPEGKFKSRDSWVRLICYTPQGQRINHQDYTLKQNTALSIELSDLLKQFGQQTPYWGLIRMDTDINVIGSTRCYMHWYNENALSSTHEKYSIMPLKVGYLTLNRVLGGKTYETYLSITNLTKNTHQDTAHLCTHEGEEVGQRTITLGPNSSMFVKVNDWFTGLTDKKGLSLYFKQPNPLMVYYFAYNKERDTWFVQHL